MTPPELAKSGTEHGEQRALFAWAAMAEQYGFAAAWSEDAYRGKFPDPQPVPELKWFHAIPNGGARGDNAKSSAIRGAQLKAEGVKSGIPDTFLPLPMWGAVTPAHTHLRCITYAGLYVEMKRQKSEGRRKGSTSTEQDEAIAWLRHSGYAVSVCFTWEQAAKEIQSYIEAVRKGEQRHAEPELQRQPESVQALPWERLQLHAGER